MGARWDIAEGHKLVASINGAESADKFRGAAQALARECGHAEYHAIRVRELQRAVDTSGHEDPGRAVLIQIAQVAEGLPTGREFAHLRFAGSAHLMACVRCLHAAIDLCGAVVYHGLNLFKTSEGRLTVRRTFPHQVLRELLASGLFPGVRAQLGHLCGHEDVIYIKDVSNASKHRTLIGTPYTVSMKFDGTPSPHGFRIEAFDFDRRSHASRDALEVSGQMQVRVVSTLIDAMNELSRELSKASVTGA